MGRRDDDEKEVRFLVFALHAMGYDAEAIALHAAEFMYEQELSWRVRYPRVHCTLDDHSRSACRRLFRFEAHEIRRVVVLLDLPEEIYTSQGCVIPREEAFCLLLRRLTYTARLEDLRSEFGRSAGALSSAINTTADLVYQTIEAKMNLDQRMVERYKERSAAAIYRKGGRLFKCLGFIDGTIRQTCRPVRFQEQLYSDHKRKHGIKFQNTTMANGLIVSMFEPVEGRRHDGFIFQESKVVNEMERHPGYHLYGDQGYPLKSWLITPFSDSQRTAEQCSFNRDLSRARIAVEWSFGWIVRYWKFFAVISNMKVLKSPVATLFIVAAFLSNCLACVRRKNQASKYFRCQLPSLDVYLAGLCGSSPINEADYPSDENVLNFFDDESDMSSEDESSDGDDNFENREVVGGGNEEEEHLSDDDELNLANYLQSV